MIKKVVLALKLMDKKFISSPLRNPYPHILYFCKLSHGPCSHSADPFGACRCPDGGGSGKTHCLNLKRCGGSRRRRGHARARSGGHAGRLVDAGRHFRPDAHPAKLPFTDACIPTVSNSSARVLWSLHHGIQGITITFLAGVKWR